MWLYKYKTCQKILDLWTLQSIDGFKHLKNAISSFYNTFTNHKTLKLDNKTRQSHHLSSKKFLRVAKYEKRYPKLFKALMCKTIYKWFFCNRTFQCGQRNIAPNIEFNLFIDYQVISLIDDNLQC